MKLYLIVAAYATVFVAEMLGDKSLLTISSLAARFRALPLCCGIAAAFMGKMLAAVLLGRTVAELPSSLVAAISAASFFITGLFIWFRKPGQLNSERDASRTLSEVSLISFGVIFLSEWGDVGQITAAALTARYGAPFMVWLGATMALMTKGALAIGLGAGLQRFIPQHGLRRVALCVCLVMAILAALGIR
jgi:putative Ca2+/H+ antiporter (TMEM165/GDT1 family)